MASKVLTIVFTDIKGFTERTAKSDRDFATRLRKKHDELLKPLIALYGGVLVKTIGDAFLLTYESPTNAVLCAMMMQETLREYNRTATEDQQIPIRVAINTGEVTVQGGDILGEPVNVASRVEGVTEAGEIWFTEATYLAMNKQEVPTSFVGDFRLKGVPEAIKVYRVILDPDSEVFKRALATQSERVNMAPAEGFSASPRVVLLVLAAVFLIGIVELALTGNLFKSFPSVPVTELRELIGKGQFNGVQKPLDEWLAADPKNPEAQKLARDLVRAQIRLTLKKETLEKSRKDLKEAYAHFTFLQPDTLMEAELTIAEAWKARESGQKDEAQEIVDRLARERPNDPEIIQLVARFYQVSGINWLKIIDYSVQEYKLASSAIATDPNFLQTCDWYLSTVGLDSDVPEFTRILCDFYLPKVKDSLLYDLYNFDPEKRIRRWNARRFLPSMATMTVDLLRFYACELTQESPDLTTPQPFEAINFFRTSTFSPRPGTVEDRAFVASITPALASAASKVERYIGDLGRLNQDTSSYTLYLEAQKKALADLKNIQ